MPLPISPGPESGSRSSSPDDPPGVSPPGPAPAPPPRARSIRPYLRYVGRVMLGAFAVGFACLAYAYLTLPDVRPLRSANPTTTAFIELRADDARSRGEAPRRFQKWTRYRDISSDLKRAVLASEDDAFWQHEGI